MPTVPVFNLAGLNLKTSPFLQGNGQILRAVNVQRDSLGAFQKRPGYITYLGTPDNSQVNTLFAWRRNDGTTFHTYRTSGSILYHSEQGTGAWTVSGNGTITNGGHFGHAVLDDVMIGGDGGTDSRHTTNGTSFTNTVGAPLAEHWTDYESRVWAARGTATSGTNTDKFFSTTGTATDWTTDSSSIRVPGEGQINAMFKANQFLIDTKDSGAVFRYDGQSLTDTATSFGPSSPYSVANIQGYQMYLNRVGVFGHGGGLPELLSAPIERLIYNESGSAIVGTTFDSAPGVIHQNKYYVSVGNTTDNLTGLTIANCLLRYDVPNDDWVTWSMNVRPTAFGTFLDASNDLQMIFGDANGQCYQLSGTALTDNGAAISAELMGFIHGGSLDEKKWKRLTLMFNPGCEANVQVAISDTFSSRTLVWKNIGQAIDGVVECHFQEGSRGRFCFWRITEMSRTSRFQFYGLEYDAEIIRH